MTSSARASLTRRVVLVGVLVVFGVLAWGALTGGLRQLPRAQTMGQRIETAIQIVCGLLSVLAPLTSIWWRRWAASLRVAWAASFVASAGLSALVWGPPMPLVALAFAGGALLLAILFMRVLETRTVLGHRRSMNATANTVMDDTKRSPMGPTSGFDLQAAEG